MQKLLVILLLIYSVNALASYRVCGADTIGRDYAYSAIADQNGIQLASWAAGDACGGGVVTENTDVNTMCENTVVAGQAICGKTTVYGRHDLDETTEAAGNWCWCRRTRVLSNGELVDSVGQWIFLGFAGNLCKSECAMYCAENVVNNVGGMHHAIMVLPEI